MATPSCVSDITEMECTRSEIDELIKEVSGRPAALPGPWEEPRGSPRGAAPLLPWPGLQSPGLSRAAAPAPPRRKARPASAVWPPRRLVPRLHPESRGWAAGSEPVPFLPALNLPCFKHFDWQS